MADAVVIGRAALQNKQAMKWQRECAEISRQKAKMQRWYGFRRKLRLAVIALGVGYGAAMMYWVWQSGRIAQAGEALVDSLYDVSRRVGFEVETVRIEGINKLSVPYLAQHLGVDVGDPIFRHSIKEIQANLKALPEIRSARVERRLPDTLFIEIVERTVSAIWQHQGEYKLIDWDGTVLANQQRDAAMRYIVMTGDDVPTHAQAFLDMLETTPELKDQVESAMRIGDRRWDVKMRSGLVIKLPEKQAEKAWLAFSKLNLQQQLLGRPIQSIDMRIEDRLFLKMDATSDTPEKPKKLTARDI